MFEILTFLKHASIKIINGSSGQNEDKSCYESIIIAITTLPGSALCVEKTSLISFGFGFGTVGLGSFVLCRNTHAIVRDDLINGRWSFAAVSRGIYTLHVPR